MIKLGLTCYNASTLASILSLQSLNRSFSLTVGLVVMSPLYSLSQREGLVAIFKKTPSLYLKSTKTKEAWQIQEETINTVAEASGKDMAIIL